MARFGGILVSGGDVCVRPDADSSPRSVNSSAAGRSPADSPDPFRVSLD